MGKLLLLSAIVVLAWFWRDSMRIRELVLHRCRAYCNHHGYQLLDATVALSGLKLRRNRRGSLSLYRTYQFEYSIDGTERMFGQTAVFDNRIDYIHLVQKDGTRIMEAKTDENDQTP